MRSPRFFLLFLLLLTVAACGATATPEAPTPPADASTATTVSDATPDSDPTATAEEAPASPTATIVASATATTVPTPAAPADLPALPTRLEEVPGWLNTVAENGNAPEEARAALLEGEWIESEADFREMEMRPDGKPVWIVRATRPFEEGEIINPLALPGGVFIVDPQARALVYQEFGQASIESEEPFFPAPTVLTDTDFTGDMTLDLLFKLSNCGANTCFDEYHIVSYHESETPRDVIRASGNTYDGQESDDLPFVTMSYSDAYVGERTGDSIRDLYLGGGTMGSVGAGPQRARFETYAWDGEHVVLAQTEYEETDLRYFRLIDANHAFDEGDYAAARTLYTEVLERPDLIESEYFSSAEEERAALNRYAEFRLVILDILEEDYVGGQTRAEEMLAGAPDDIVAQTALEMVMRYARSESWSEACAQVRQTLEGLDPDPLAPLDYMGYSNPELGAETLCPL